MAWTLELLTHVSRGDAKPVEDKSATPLSVNGQDYALVRDSKTGTCQVNNGAGESEFVFGCVVPLRRVAAGKDGIEVERADGLAFRIHPLLRTTLPLFHPEASINKRFEAAHELRTSQENENEPHAAALFLSVAEDPKAKMGDRLEAADRLRINPRWELYARATLLKDRTVITRGEDPEFFRREAFERVKEISKTSSIDILPVLAEILTEWDCEPNVGSAVEMEVYNKAGDIITRHASFGDLKKIFENTTLHKQIRLWVLVWMNVLDQREGHFQMQHLLKDKVEAFLQSSFPDPHHFSFMAMEDLIDKLNEYNETYIRDSIQRIVHMSRFLFGFEGVTDKRKTDDYLKRFAKVVDVINKGVSDLRYGSPFIARDAARRALHTPTVQSR